MMKRRFNIFLVVLVALVSSQVVYGEGIKKNVEVLFNKINLTINGQKLDKETIEYNDTTYIPIRAVAEAFGKKVSFDESTQTANISDENSTYENKVPIIWPLRGYKNIMKGYYTYTHLLIKKELTHYGLDIKAPIGTPILAVKDGFALIVEEKDNAYGKYIVISHPDKTYTLYAHASEINVIQNQEVKQGDIIGKTGSDDISGEHLHFEIRNKNAVAVNPIDYYIK